MISSKWQHAVRGGAMALIIAACGLARTAAADAPAPTNNLRMTNTVRIYQMDKDAVVNISSTRLVQARVGTGDEIFDRFFGGVIREVPAQSLGSGFVINPAGYIVTNEHVIDQATDVKVAFSNGDKLDAEVIATDNEHDLAVLKVNPKTPLHAIQLGASEDLMIGEPVYAIGNPFGYAGTMTEGIVSAVDRTLDINPNKSYKGLIQTDASINPGNSGGPLINAYGQVVGINTAIRANAQGIGFAIAVSNMRDLLPTFLNPEATNHGQIGFTVEEKRTMLPPATVKSEVLIKTVHPNSAAAQAGLKPGDRIVDVNGAPVTDVVDALVALAGEKAGDTLRMHVDRTESGAVHRLEMVLPVTRAPAPAPNELLMSKIGIDAATVTPALVKKYRLPTSRGVFVTAVKSDSPAGTAGVQPGDVIFQIGPYRVNTVEELEGLLKTVKTDVDARIGIIRGDELMRGTIHVNK